MKKNQLKLISNLLLLLTALIWGIAFVAQSVGTDYVGPWTFVFSRYVLSAAVLLPVTLLTDRRAEKAANVSTDQKSFRAYLRGGACCGILLGIASIAQQAGIQYTTAGKAGFITALYVILVPLIGLFLGKRPEKKIWLCVALGLLGLYLISVKEGFRIEKGDALVMVCAFVFSLQILSVDHFSSRVLNPVKLANLQFVFCALIALVGMLLFEKPQFSAILDAAVPILYAGVCSGAIGYTLQIVGQKNTDPAIASLLMSLEAVFSALAGWVILHEALSARELLGCMFVFLAVILAELPVSALLKKRT